MTIQSIRDALQATVLEGQDRLSSEIVHVYASDLMSDVLAFGKPSSILITGLATEQSIIAAHMAEFLGVVLIRGKKLPENAVRLAHDYHMVLLATPLDMYETVTRVSMKWTQRMPAFGSAPKPVKQEMLLEHEMKIEGNDFSRAGMVSTEVKALLKKIGIDPKLIRRVAISAYEAEMNVVLHAHRGRVKFDVTPTMIELMFLDEGPGIPDVNQAMQEGYSTATDEIRKMGFGSGMGLANIKRNSDKLDIRSTVGEGTTVHMQFFI